MADFCHSMAVFCLVLFCSTPSSIFRFRKIYDTRAMLQLRLAISAQRLRIRRTAPRSPHMGSFPGREEPALLLPGFSAGICSLLPFVVGVFAALKKKTVRSTVTLSVLLPFPAVSRRSCLAADLSNPAQAADCVLCKASIGSSGAAKVTCVLPQLRQRFLKKKIRPVKAFLHGELC